MFRTRPVRPVSPSAGLRNIVLPGQDRKRLVARGILTILLASLPLADNAARAEVTLQLRDAPTASDAASTSPKSPGPEVAASDAEITISLPRPPYGIAPEELMDDDELEALRRQKEAAEKAAAASEYEPAEDTPPADHPDAVAERAPSEGTPVPAPAAIAETVATDPATPVAPVTARAVSSAASPVTTGGAPARIDMDPLLLASIAPPAPGQGTRHGRISAVPSDGQASSAADSPLRESRIIKDGESREIFIGSASPDKLLRGAEIADYLKVASLDPHGLIPRRELVVKLSTQTLYAFEDGKLTMSMPVVVGKPHRRYHTPRITDRVIKVILNPDWYPTQSMIKRGVRPGRRAPSDNHPMGQVKIVTEKLSRQAIVLHGVHSRLRKFFTQANRKLSSGCVRLPQEVDVAKFILEGTEGWDDSRIEKVVATNRMTTVIPSTPVTVRIVN